MVYSYERGGEMASRIMHYTVAYIIANTIEIRDMNKFILGNLEPDMSSKNDNSYTTSHFGAENRRNGTKGINWVAFVEKYKENILMDDEMLGYFVHLITDAIWLKNIRDKNIRKYSGEKRKELTIKGYSEMSCYNKIFIEKYQLENVLHTIDDIVIKEANMEYKDTIINGLISDFSQNRNTTEKFEVFPYNEVMGFIGEAVQKCIIEITSLRVKRSLSDPEEFYVKQ